MDNLFQIWLEKIGKNINKFEPSKDSGKIKYFFYSIKIL